MALKIVWTKRALARTTEVANWYVTKMGTNAAHKFVTDLEKTISCLSNSPTIGRKENISKEYNYYSFLIHPKYRVIYRFDSENLFIIALRAIK